MEYQPADGENFCRVVPCMLKTYSRWLSSVLWSVVLNIWEDWGMWLQKCFNYQVKREVTNIRKKTRIFQCCVPICRQIEKVLIGCWKRDDGIRELRENNFVYDLGKKKIWQSENFGDHCGQVFFLSLSLSLSSGFRTRFVDLGGNARGEGITNNTSWSGRCNIQAFNEERSGDTRDL